MADYQDIRGLRVKYLSADPDNAVGGEVWYNSTTGTLRSVVQTEAWSSAPFLGTPRFAAAGASTQTSGLIFGGWGGPGGGGPFTPSTEEYDGSGWSAGGTMNNHRHYMLGLGATATAALAGGGEPVPFIQKTEEYNGTAWTEVNNNPTPFKNQFTGTGTQTAGLSIMGYNQPAGTATNACYEYDGTNWTAATDMGTALYDQTGNSGTQTAGLVVGGWNGSANITTTTAYDGTSWITNPSTARASSGHSAATGAPSTAALVQYRDGDTDGTEEFTAESTALNLKTITDS